MREKKQDTVNTIEINNNEEDISYDQLILTAGEIGKYQLVLCCWTLPFYIFGVFSYFSQLFITEVAPQHWCWIPELANLSTIDRRNLAIPLDEKSSYGYSRCLVYQANWTQVLAAGVRPDPTWITVPCQHGWEFNQSEFAYPTISSELGWVCDKDDYQAAGQSVYFFGSIFGGFLMGFVADRFGRLPVVILSNVFGAVAGIACIYAQNFFQFAIWRFLMGMSYDSCMIMVYIIVLEYISPKYRTLLTNITFAVFYTFGAVALPWIALACGNWRTVSLATSIPMILAIFAPIAIPESARWLLSKGRVDDVVKQVLRIGQVNKRNIPQDVIDKFKRGVLKNKEEDGNIIDLIKRPYLRKTFICSCIVYTGVMMVFDGLVRIIGQLKFNFFSSFSLISLTELPSLIIISFALDFTGRKLMVVSVMTFCAIASFIGPLTHGGLPSVICAILARFGVNMAVNSSLQWISEVLPTSVRGSGTSLVHICGYLGTVVSPFVAYLDRYMPGLPMIVIGSVALVVVLVSLFLPETANRDIPQTFDDAEHLYKHQKLFSIPFIENRKRAKE